MAKQPKAERMIGVLRYGAPFGSVPDWFVSRQEAQYLLDCHFAVWRARYCLVLTKPLPLKLRDLSASMGPSVMFAAACGSRHHQSLVEAWAQ